MMITGSCGWAAFTFCSRSRPDSPGMRMSESITAGGWLVCSRVSSASLAELKLRKGMSSRLSAFSRTQRMERSSSMIQTLFIVVCTVMVRGSWLTRGLKSAAGS